MANNGSENSTVDERSVVPMTETATYRQDEVDAPEIPASRNDNAESAQAFSSRRRRRVSRACDECRRKKIKCSGKQPCEHCTVYEFDCTFDKPSYRRRNPPPQERHALEQKLQRAESLLRMLMPAADLDSILREERTTAGENSRIAVDSRPETEGEQFMTLVEGIRQVGLDDNGEWDFRGLSSDAAYLSRIIKDLPELLSYDPRTPFLPQAPRPYIALPLGFPACDTPGLRADPCYYELPSRELAHTLCEYSFNCATCLLRTIHIPSFYRMFDSLYNLPLQPQSCEQRRFRGLLYAVLALGSMYDVDENDPSNPNHYAEAMDRGFKYYISARLSLDDLTECRDLTTLQAIVFIIQFLQATANLNGCYTFIGIAVRSALRMGLHRRLTHPRITPIEDETRRRVFHVIRQMDIYLSTTLGLPLLLKDKDITQPLPTEVDDDYITDCDIHRPSPATPSFLQAFNAHARLMGILAKIVEHLYPPDGIGEANNVAYMVSYDQIKGIERDLRSWSDQLPTTWRPGPNGAPQVLRVRALLRFAYAHVQMMLYRPFLRFSPHNDLADNIPNKVSYPYQDTGISVCRNIVQIGQEIRKQAVLLGPHWFILYTQFLAVLSLVACILENPDHPSSSEILGDAELGKDGICGLAQRSLPADRVSAALNSLFENLRCRLRPTTRTIEPSECHLGLGVSGVHSVSPRAQAGVSPEPIGRTDMLASSDAEGTWKKKFGLAATMSPSEDPECGFIQQQTWSHENPQVQFRSHSNAFITNTITFLPEDPFAYPLLEDIDAIDQLFHDTDSDKAPTQLQLFPDQGVVMNNQPSSLPGSPLNGKEEPNGMANLVETAESGNTD